MAMIATNAPSLSVRRRARAPRKDGTNMKRVMRVAFAATSLLVAGYGHGEAATLNVSALPAFVWVEIEAATVEEDGGLEMRRIAKPARRLLHPLDNSVDGLEPGVGQAMS